MKLARSFYNRDTLIVARELLGKILVHNINGIKVSGEIVETEAYMGTMDKAAHSYNGRRTQRVEPMYGKPGTAYVYFIYGMYYCFNVVTREEGNPQAVLIRALKPVCGLDIISLNRFNKKAHELKNREIINLTNGPSKLCSGLHIDKSLNYKDLCGEELYIEYGKEYEFTVGTSRRIGIDYAEEAREYPWRFYIENDPYVSKKRIK